MKVRLLNFAGYQIADEIGDILRARVNNKCSNGYVELYVKSSTTNNNEWFLFPPTAFEIIKEKDSIVESVISQYRERSEVGIKKYNNTMDRNDLSTSEWLTHLQQELMDATLYIEKLKKELK